MGSEQQCGCLSGSRVRGQRPEPCFGLQGRKGMFQGHESVRTREVSLACLLLLSLCSEHPFYSEKGARLEAGCAYRALSQA